MARRVFKGFGAVAVLALGVGLNFYQLPVVTLLPGPIEDVLPQVKVDGAETYDSDGRLYLTTVGVDDQVNFYEALLQFADHDVEVLPRHLLYPEDKTDEQVDVQNAAAMDGSKLAATVVALRASGYEIDDHPDGVRVVGVVSGSAADGRLEPGDRIIAVQDQPVEGAEQVRDTILGAEIDADVKFTIERGGDTHEVNVTASAAPDGPRRPFVGIRLSDEFDFPIDVEIQTENIGGPSAGLMFTLAIIDKLGQTDLTSGRKIAGTGTVDLDGNIGPIGGIRQKLIAAAREGAQVFLTPQGNYEEARQYAPGGLSLVPVSTVDDALEYLRQEPPTSASAAE